jgi:hypothetical protein
MSKLKIYNFKFHIWKTILALTGTKILQSRIFKIYILSMDNKKKGGRPISENKKEKSKVLYFSNTEFQYLENLFNESDYQNMNEMFRDILLKNEYRVVSFDTESIVKKSILVEQVRRIGNNFNQLIKALNQRKLDSLSQYDIKSLQENIKDIKEIYIKIESEVRNDS